MSQSIDVSTLLSYPEFCLRSNANDMVIVIDEKFPYFMEQIYSLPQLHPVAAIFVEPR